MDELRISITARIVSVFIMMIDVDKSTAAPSIFGMSTTTGSTSSPGKITCERTGTPTPSNHDNPVIFSWFFTLTFRDITGLTRNRCLPLDVPYKASLILYFFWTGAVVFQMTLNTRYWKAWPVLTVVTTDPPPDPSPVACRRARPFRSPTRMRSMKKIQESLLGRLSPLLALYQGQPGKRKSRTVKTLKESGMLILH